MATQSTITATHILTITPMITQVWPLKQVFLLRSGLFLRQSKYEIETVWAKSENTLFTQATPTQRLSLGQGGTGNPHTRWANRQIWLIALSLGSGIDGTPRMNSWRAQKSSSSWTKGQPGSNFFLSFLLF